MDVTESLQALPESLGSLERCPLLDTWHEDDDTRKSPGRLGMDDRRAG
jgi:hypothetical protein